MLFDHVQHIFAALVAILADEQVDGLVLAKFVHAGGQHHQLAAVHDGHARAVDSLVAQPGTLKLRTVQQHHGLADGPVHQYQVLLLGQRHGFLKAGALAAYKQAVHVDVALRGGGNGQDVGDGHMHQEVVLGIVKHLAHRRMVAAHDALHAIERAQHVAGVDHARAAASHQHVFVAVGHAHHLVRHHLADGQDDIVRGVKDALVNLHRHSLVDQPFGNFGQESCGHLAHLHHIVAPVVHNHAVKGDAAKHALPFRLGDGHMGAQRGQDIHRAGVLEHVVQHLSNGPGIGVEARVIRRQQQHFFKLRQPVLKRMFQRLTDVPGA